VTADEYLFAILRREAVNTGTNSPVRGVQTVIDPIVRQWASTQLVSVLPSGSFAKGPGNSSGTDIDLFISLKHDTRETLKEIYNRLFTRMTERGFSRRT
jgi:tRNA nucleotidyltransferase (CCA-adding enzyme)